VWQFGRVAFVIQESGSQGSELASRDDKAWEIVRGRPRLLILDEINVVADFGLIPSRKCWTCQSAPKWMT